MSLAHHSSLALYLVMNAVILLVEVILMEEICWETTIFKDGSGLLKVLTAHLTLANTSKKWAGMGNSSYIFGKTW